ncbi:MAG: M48 family metallopeptidase, partial [Deltaproteobacteria bacterium]|nr:M48 family metallopeptidase [Deltaproteobacteria bacterium]
MISINNFLTAYLFIYAISLITDIIIDLVNAAHLKKFNGEIPEGFEGLIDKKRLSKMEGYTRANTYLGVLSTTVTKAVFLIIILSGVLPWFLETVDEWHYIPAALLFFAFPWLIGFLIEIPFDYCHTFRIEERYGFNTNTLGTWIIDHIKSMIITVIIFSMLLSILLFMIKHTGNTWWIWAWLFFISFQLLMTVLYPTLIAPIFNKFEPVKDTELETAIRNLAEKEGLRVKDIFQMDAGKRSRHTNAYFTGLGRTKRIVLYDTLIASHNRDEILSVLAHEIGHLKHGHIKKMIFMTAIVSFILFFIVSRAIEWGLLYESFGFRSIHPYVGIFLTEIILEPLGFFLSPMGMAISRRHEREADDYVFRIMNTIGPFVSALKKMASDNLSNLRPHPLYVYFH